MLLGRKEHIPNEKNKCEVHFYTSVAMLLTTRVQSIQVHLVYFKYISTVFNISIIQIHNNVNISLVIYNPTNNPEVIQQHKVAFTIFENIYAKIAHTVEWI